MRPAHSPSPARTLRARARASLAGAWWLAILAFVIALVLGGSRNLPLLFYAPSWDLSVAELFVLIHDLARELLLWAVSDFAECFGTLVTLLLGISLLLFTEPWSLLTSVAPLLWEVVLTSLPLWSVWLLVGSSIRLGQARFRLQLLDGQRASLKSLFFAFREHYFKALWLRVLRCLMILAWSLLLIVPGIIAAYRYAMAEYALAENPEMRAIDALRESARMMRGNKWRLFCLRLSMAGWWLLCLLSLGIGFLWLSPYLGQAEAAFYDEASGRAKVREMVEEMAKRDLLLD